ncbi:MAG: YkgJ family cysteine cluster protein [Verrucomicrobiota bacterium]
MTPSHSDNNDTPPLKLRIARDQRFACIQCGRCCRRWHVALTRKEIEHLRSLSWPPGDAPEQDPVTVIRRQPTIAHRDNGDCIYLDPKTGLCSIHSRFGEHAKPFGCRIYPFSIGSTFAGEVSVTARMDCPAACRNEGLPLSEKRAELKRFAVPLAKHTHTFDSHDLQGLSQDGAEAAADGAIHIVRNTERSIPLTAVLLSAYADRLHQLGSAFINDANTFATVAPSLIDRLATTAVNHTYRPVGPVSRAVFRQWLATCLRRDEEVIGKPGTTRIARTVELTRMLVNRGNPSRLGAEHPDLTLDRAKLFEKNRTPQPIPAVPTSNEMDVWEPLRRCLVGRLETRQFFGPFLYGRPLLEGLRALALFYPPVLAAARLHATAETGTPQIRPADVEYAVGTVDHSFGRAGRLQSNLLRSTEIFFGGLRHASLLASLRWR